MGSDGGSLGFLSHALWRVFQQLAGILKTRLHSSEERL